MSIERGKSRKLFSILYVATEKIKILQKRFVSVNFRRRRGRGPFGGTAPADPAPAGRGEGNYTAVNAVSCRKTGAADRRKAIHFIWDVHRREGVV